MDPRQRERFKRMRPEEKLEAALLLRKSAWELKRAGIREDHPEWPDAQIEAAVRQFFLHARDENLSQNRQPPAG